jgi:hypothetical protein
MTSAMRHLSWTLTGGSTGRGRRGLSWWASVPMAMAWPSIRSGSRGGAVFYVAHDMLGGDRPLDEMVIRVADSPSAYVQRRGEEDFPWDYWEAKAGNTEPNASPYRRPARQRPVQTPRRGGGR